MATTLTIKSEISIDAPLGEVLRLDLSEEFKFMLSKTARDFAEKNRMYMEWVDGSTLKLYGRREI